MLMIMQMDMKLKASELNEIQPTGTPSLIFGLLCAWEVLMYLARAACARGGPCACHGVMNADLAVKVIELHRCWEAVNVSILIVVLFAKGILDKQWLQLFMLEKEMERIYKPSDLKKDENNNPWCFF